IFPCIVKILPYYIVLILVVSQCSYTIIIKRPCTIFIVKHKYLIGKCITICLCSICAIVYPIYFLSIIIFYTRHALWAIIIIGYIKYSIGYLLIYSAYICSITCMNTRRSKPYYILIKYHGRVY